MGKDNEKLLEIYNEAKRRRLVLSKGEFAKKLGYSRAHIHQLMSSDDNVSPDILSKAVAVLSETPVIRMSIKEEELLNERTERTIAREAMIKLIFQELKELKAHVMKRPLREISMDLDRAAERAAKLDLDEWLKQSS
jgi:transcriptional regulator with XRE-family HTH domain